MIATNRRVPCGNTATALILMLVMFDVAPAIANPIDHPHTFRYEHEYTTEDRTHEEKLRLSRAFDNGIELGLETDFLPRAHDDGSAGSALHHLHLHKTRLIFEYKRHLTGRVAFEPEVELELENHETTWKTELKLPIRLTAHVDIEPGYEFKTTHYSTAGKQRQNRHEPMLALIWHRGRWQIGYRRKQIHANRPVYDHGKHDHEDRIKIKYDLANRWTPYVDLRNVSTSRTSSRRQAEIRIGFDYSF